MIETWADRSDYQGARAAMMNCPCCGKMRTADSIILLPMAIRSQVASRFNKQMTLEYACTAALSVLRRENIITKDDIVARG